MHLAHNQTVLGSSPRRPTNHKGREGKIMNLNRYFGRDDIAFMKIVLVVAAVTVLTTLTLL